MIAIHSGCNEWWPRSLSLGAFLRTVFHCVMSQYHGGRIQPMDEGRGTPVSRKEAYLDINQAVWHSGNAELFQRGSDLRFARIN